MQNSLWVDDHDDAALISREPIKDDARFDITAMIDLVFMMNIFFLVTTVGAALSQMDLPTARHCVAADLESCVVISVMSGADARTGEVYLGDGTVGEPLVNRDDQTREVRRAVQEGVKELKQTVLIKAEQNVRLQVLGRIAGAAASIPGVELRLAVVEQESRP